MRPIDDAGILRGVLIDAAKAREPLTYSQVLARLGHRFTRPKMRLLCRTLEKVDAAARAAGEPELAVLVVRGADGLPGEGWWEGGWTWKFGYDGPRSGKLAELFVRGQQALVYAYWDRGA